MTDERKSGRAIFWTVASTVVVVVAAVVYVWELSYRPAYGSSLTGEQQFVKLGTAANGQKTAMVRIDIQPAVGKGPNAPWLGYQTPDGANPGTVFSLPENALVTVVIHNYDSQTALRNTFFTLVQGTVGNVEYLNGKPLKVMDPTITSHTFTISDLGVSVPMAGVPSNAKPNQYETMKFTFRTHGKGVYRWQCIVPCGWGLYGNGGPMQEIGYMDGIISVG